MSGKEEFFHPDKSHAKRVEVGKNRPGPVLRVRLLWRAGTWRVAKLIRLPLKTLPNTALADPEKGKVLRGLWFEAVDRQGKIVVRRRILESLPLTAELFDPKGGFKRVTVAPEEFLLDLLFEDRLEIVAVRIMANPNPFHRTIDGGFGAAKELAYLDLTVTPDGKDGKEAHDVA